MSCRYIFIHLSWRSLSNKQDPNQLRLIEFYTRIIRKYLNFKKLDYEYLILRTFHLHSWLLPSELEHIYVLIPYLEVLVCNFAHNSDKQHFNQNCFDNFQNTNIYIKNQTQNYYYYPLCKHQLLHKNLSILSQFYSHLCMIISNLYQLLNTIHLHI